MSSALAERAIDAAFRTWGVDASYTPAGGASRVIRVLLSRPDEIVDVGGFAQVGAATMVEIRKSEVAAPKKGDGLTVDGKAYKLGEPRQPDGRRLKWRASLTPA